MKKIIFTLIVLFQCQLIFSQNFKMGLYVSPSINWINFGEYDSEGSNSGFNYGYHIEYGLTENHFLTSGFEISHKGGENLLGKYKLHYFVLPLQVKMKSRPFGNLTYFAQVGPSIGIRIRDDIKDESGINDMNNQIDEIYGFIFEVDKHGNITYEDGRGKNLIMMINLSLGVEYSLRQETVVYSELFLKNNITNAWKNGDFEYETFLVNQVGLSIGFLF